ncbi:MAG: putative toxin-antitoxin system toxin component, PIN family [Deltaproteobacteria bacterium]|nr:putative toxin-antitoxin system toxin component, PIN family [Deltaproteobacteria bacterium]
MSPQRPKPTPTRVVLDTNLVLAALVFGGGSSAVLRDGWHSQRFTPLVSRETTSELIRVLTHPKFGLTRRDQEDLLADYLPFCTTIKVPVPPPPTPSCRDPFDIPFLTLAIADRADFLVTGDLDLLSLSTEFSCLIVKASEFLDQLQPA